MTALHQIIGYLARHPEGTIPIDVAEAPIRKEAIVTKGQNWIKFYPMLKKIYHMTCCLQWEVKLL
jgi:hypothetical protein